MNRLHEYRRREGWSKKRLAERMNVSLKFINDIEKGRTFMNNEQLKLAAKLLFTKPDNLRTTNPNHSMVCQNCGLHQNEINQNKAGWCHVGKYIKEKTNE